MATIRQYICKNCPPKNAGRLFDALKKKAKGKILECQKCGMPYDSLRLKFDFALGATNSECTVLDCFLPKDIAKWKDGKKTVEFYPFLVIVKRHGKENATWLPYWHIIKDKEKKTIKYGQWAPFMDSHLFNSLLEQAKKKGY